MSPTLLAAFTLGLKIAEYAHGLGMKRDQTMTDKIIDILEGVARGELTMQNTPEETFASLPGPPPELAAKAPELVKQIQDNIASQMPEMTRQIMRAQREVATELLTMILPKKT